MNNFTVTLCIIDRCCTKNCNNILQRELIITSSDDTIELQNSYVLNVATVNSNSVTVIVQNGTNVIIRNVFETFPTDIILSENCPNHILNITAKATLT